MLENTRMLENNRRLTVDPQRAKFCTYAFFILCGLIFLLAIIFSAIHSIEEGHVGVYRRGGKILDEITDPGYNFKLPFITEEEEVNIIDQTDEVHNVKCGTKNGIVLMFTKIEVVNKLTKPGVLYTIKNFGFKYDKALIFDKIHHEVNKICANYTFEEIYIDKFALFGEYLKESIQKDVDIRTKGLEIKYRVFYNKNSF